MCIHILPDGRLECFTIEMPVEGTGKASHGIYVKSVQMLGSMVREEGSNWTDTEKLVRQAIEAVTAGSIKEEDDDEVVLRRAASTLLNKEHAGLGDATLMHPLILAHVSSRKARDGELMNEDYLSTGQWF